MAKQVRLLRNLSLTVLALVITLAPALSVIGQESITLTTIMPSQDTLRVKRGAVGTTYKDSTNYPDSAIGDDNLIIEGNVGIGTDSPNNKLQVSGLINFDDTLESTYLGHEAGYGATADATRNTFIGYDAGYSNISGDENVALGKDAFQFHTTGSSNTAIGTVALRSSTSGTSNTAVGRGALYKTAWHCNVGVGSGAGFLADGGSGNVYLGYNAGYNATGSDKLYIANSSTDPPLIYGEFNTGKVGIGTTSPGYTLDVNGTIASTGQSGLVQLFNPDAATGAVNVNTGDNFQIRTGNAPRVTVLGSNGNVGIGTTNPQHALAIESWYGAVMLHNTGGVPTPAGGWAGIYESGGELWAIDGAGITKLLSPHDSETGEWIFYSKNVKTGRVVRVNMERLVKKIEEITGESFLEEWIEQ